MTRDDIIKLAREAKCVKAQYPMLPWRVSEEALEAFANLVAAAEREACAALCEGHVRYPSRLHFAAAIRARGQA